jgi:hypothetical protein
MKVVDDGSKESVSELTSWGRRLCEVSLTNCQRADFFIAKALGL